MKRKYKQLDQPSNKIQGHEVTDVWFDEYFNELCGGNFKPLFNPAMENHNGSKSKKPRTTNRDSK